MTGYLDEARRAAAHVFVEDLASPLLTVDDLHHLGRVLRLRAGEPVSVVDGQGGWRLCSFVDGPGLEPAGDVIRLDAPSPPITVGLALTKGDRPEWAVQKLTEIGVDRVVPLITARSVVRWEGARAERHVARWREVARQAAMQSRRLRLPVIDPVRSLPEALATLPSPAIAVPGGRPPSLARSTVLVGPEGGWTPEEERAAESGVDLGPAILRTETAAVMVASLLSALRHGLLSP